MARYWVGGTNTWNGVAGAKWAAISGGAGGQSVPNGTEDVFFDAASGAGTITIAVNSLCKSLDCTGFTGTLAGTLGTLFLFGGMTLNPTMGYTFDGSLTFQATSGGPWPVITTGQNVSANHTISFNGVGGSWVLMDDMNCPTTNLFLLAGDLDLSGRTLTLRRWNGLSAGVSPRSVDFSNTLWILDGQGAANEWIMGPANLTGYDSTNSEIRLVNVGAGVKTFSAGGLIYNKVKFLGGGTGPFTMNGSNTIAELTFVPGIIVSVSLTQTVDSLIAIGTPGNLITLKSSSLVNQCVFSRPAGRVVCDYLDIARVRAEGGARWFAGRHSVNSGGNNGWIFTDALIAPSSIVDGVGV